MLAGKRALVGAFLFVSPSLAGAQTPIGGCRFDAATLSFAGTVQEQARCLLMKVRPHGGRADPQPVPDWLRARMGQPVGITGSQLLHYLESVGVRAADVGASPAADAANARYFVIHDTSYPEVDAGEDFPGDINSPAYSGNNLDPARWGRVPLKVNLIVSRDGRSRLFQDWPASRPSPALKIEEDGRIPRSRRVFVHVENVQPRTMPRGSTWHWRAPVPGFTPAQEERLALAYVVASVRAGRWLIPAYHFNIDFGLPRGHDDPQNTDLNSWVERLSTIENSIRNPRP